MTPFLRRTWATIDLDALRHNYRMIVAATSANCRIMAVVKADGYGHGAVAVARLLQQEGVGYFAVSNVDEAEQLRSAGITEPILILSYTPPTEAARLARLHITQTVISREYGEQLHAECEKADVRLRIHLKVDTGMARVGFFCRAGAEIGCVNDIAAVCALPRFEAEGIFTHFSSADETPDTSFTEAQFALFMDVIHRLQQRGIAFALRHCCNSAALMRFPAMHLDMVRPGIILYGHAPNKALKDILPLRPAMTVRTVLSQIKTVPTGTVVSYGRTYTADTPRRIATVPVGYADGLPRSFSNNWRMELCGGDAPIIGRICMDQCMLDITHLPTASVGDEVILLGGDGACSAERFAATNHTIHYEVVCDIGKRVPRLFVEGGHIVDQLNYIAP